MSRTRIPEKIGDFNAYLNDTTNYLLAAPAPSPLAAETAGAALAVVPNYVRLGITDAEMNQWRNYHDQWNALYPLYTQKKQTRTTSIKDQLRIVQKNFSRFVHESSLFERIISSVNRTLNDLEEFHIKAFPLKDANPTQSHVQVITAPVFALVPIGSGDMNGEVRAFDDSTRASKLKGFEVEVRYAFLPQDEPRHLQIADLNNSQIFSKAKFILHCGTDKQGKLIFAAARWINITDPGRNSPWSVISYVLV